MATTHTNMMDTPKKTARREPKNAKARQTTHTHPVSSSVSKEELSQLIAEATAPLAGQMEQLQEQINALQKNALQRTPAPSKRASAASVRQIKVPNDVGYVATVLPIAKRIYDRLEEEAEMLGVSLTHFALTVLAEAVGEPIESEDKADSDTFKTYTVEEVGNMLNLSPLTVINYLKAGKIKGKKIGRRWRILPEDLDAFVRGS